MSSTLKEIAQQLRDNKKVQLIYAFNGTGKTRLSREFKSLLSPNDDDKTEEQSDEIDNVLYYNALTEDLFYWDNDLENDVEHKLKIQPNSFTSWVLGTEGKDKNVISKFQHYTDEKLNPEFSDDFQNVSFSFKRGNEEPIIDNNIKISKGEESSFIWCIFYSLFKSIIEILNVAEPSERETNKFDKLEYVFIDDPVSSLDDNHLIRLAVDLATLIKSSDSKLKFIITTHNPLFYNVLCNEFNRKYQYRLDKLTDGTFSLEEQPTDSPFSYHLFLIREIDKAIKNDKLEKYHFSFLRNVLEKTSTFLGYEKWGELLPLDEQDGDNHYERRILNLYSHSKHSTEEVTALTDGDKAIMERLIKKVIKGKLNFKSYE